jgi:putative transcriptional regulator
MIGYLGFLGFLGLLGLITDNPGFFGFFGFFGFWSPMWGKGSDERVDQNVNRASRNAFVFTTAASAIVFSYIAILQTAETFQLAISIAALFAGGLTVFVASFIYYDRFSSWELRVFGMKTKIKELREKRNLTQEALAEKVDVTRQTILFLEKGKYNPSLRLAYRIAKALNSRIEEIFSFEDERL